MFCSLKHGIYPIHPGHSANVFSGYEKFYVFLPKHAHNKFRKLLLVSSSEFQINPFYMIPFTVKMVRKNAKVFLTATIVAP